MYGFTGKILEIDLGEKRCLEVSKDSGFYREHLGGSFLCARLFEEYVRPGAHAFSPHNPLVFATGPLAGRNVCGATRVNLFTISPETTGTYLSQAGGDFGPALKRAGYDALVINGKADAPLYVKVTARGDRPKVEFIEADRIWGMETIRAGDVLENELGPGYTIASIGPAGENLVACANVMFEAGHYAGRGGFGAVMGSKNLKAICVSGGKGPELRDRKKVLEINRKGAARLKEASPDGFMGVLRNLGTMGLLALNQEAGNLPTRNFNYAHLGSGEFAHEISHSSIREKLVGKTVPCKACYVGCKKKYKEDSLHGGKSSLAEYESITLLGPNIGLEELIEGLEACELCNRMGLDTISAGAIIAWLMDCYSNGVISRDRFGFSIRFGEGKKACRLIEDMALRKTELGNLLADGLLKAASELGGESIQYLRASRGIGLPAHMPRKKPAVGLGYLHGPNPGDHMKLEHDWIAGDQDLLQGLGLNLSSDPASLDKAKVEIARITQIYYSTIDCLSLCMFVFGPGNVYTFGEIAGMVNAATGFDFSFQDLMKVGEESLQLQRKLYVRFGGEDEEFLDYLEEEIPSGPSKGVRISKEDFERARRHYYSLWNW